jgi:hypothetical protein
MYLSLDRLDVRLAPLAGRSRVVQTDHRAAAAIEADLSLSIVATAIRCLNPLRSIDQLALFYNFVEPPPPAIHETVDACGGLVWVGEDATLFDRPHELHSVDEPTVSRIVDRALVNLADELVRASSSGSPLRALEARERLLLDGGFPDEDDTSGFWSAVLHLGALTGAAIRASVGGEWFYNPTSLGSLPVDLRSTFNGGPATVNPLGKAIKFLHGKGDGEEPSFLVRVLCREA